MNPAKKAGNLRDEDVKRLRMKKTSDKCTCYTLNGFYVRWCDKHRPNGVGTHGRRS